jgi:hypothetical protein
MKRHQAIKLALLNYDIAADVVAIVIVDVTAVVAATDNVFVVAVAVINSVVVLSLLFCHLDFSR